MLLPCGCESIDCIIVEMSTMFYHTGEKVLSEYKNPITDKLLDVVCVAEGTVNL
jgi:hypothetical protein